MNVTSPDRVIEQQTADSNAPAENKFSDAAASGARHNDPRQQQGGKQQRQQGGQQKRDRRDVHGWVILDKPIGMTSTHAVAVLKRLFNAKRAGHAAPLIRSPRRIADCAGEATKTVPFVMDGRKRYRFTVQWGEERDTRRHRGPRHPDQPCPAFRRGDPGPAAAVHRHHRTDPAAVFGDQDPG